MFTLYDNEYLQWEHDGKQYTMHIQLDEGAEPPTDWESAVRLTTWCRYSIGECAGDTTQKEYWNSMVKRHVELYEGIVDDAIAGRLKEHYAVEHAKDDDWVYDICVDHGDETEVCHAGVKFDDIISCLIGELTPDECMQVLRDKMVVMPLYMCEHAGISISCNPFAAPFDSSQIGYATVDYDDFEEWAGYISMRWQDEARSLITEFVEDYNKWLHGMVFMYTLYDGDGNEIDCCGGLYDARSVVDAVEDEVEECGFLTVIRGDMEIKSDVLFVEVCKKIENAHRMPSILDYTTVSQDVGFINPYSCQVVGALGYGNNGGIYLDVRAECFGEDGKVRVCRLGTFKTLGADRADMHTMGILMADFVMYAQQYISECANTYSKT